MTQPPAAPVPAEPTPLPPGEVPPEPMVEQVPVEGDMGDEWLVQAMASNRFEIREPSPLQQMNPYESNVAPMAPPSAPVPGPGNPAPAAPPAVPPQAPGG